jgi:hypothetical protein
MYLIKFRRLKMKIGKIIIFGIVILGLSACNKNAEAHVSSLPHSHDDKVAHVSSLPHSHDDKFTHTTGASNSQDDKVLVKDRKDNKTKNSKD